MNIRIYEVDQFYPIYHPVPSKPMIHIDSLIDSRIRILFRWVTLGITVPGEW